MAFTIKSLGHSCIQIISVHGLNILFDPYLSDNKNAACKPEDLKDIDAILVSHGAFDHLGDAVDIAKYTGALLYCGPDVYDYYVFCGIPKEQLRMMVWGTCLEHKGIKIRSVEAKHISSFKFNDHKITGIPMSFIVTLEDGTGIYFAGDTAIFSDLKLFGQLYPVRYGFFCVDGLPGWPYEMDGKEAAMAADMIGVEVAIPVHYPPDTDHPNIFVKELKNINPSIQAVVLASGEVYKAI